MQLPTFSWMLPRDLRGFFPEAEKVADMAKPQKNERLAGAANPRSETVIWDDVVPKLGLRDRLGRSTWIVQWRLDGKTRKRTLGAVAEIDRETARRLATEILDADDIDQTIDKSETIASFAERYFKEMTSWKASTLQSSRGSFERYISPTLGTKKVAELSADQVQDWLASFPCSPGTASRATAILSGMMRHAELLGLREPDSNPCQGLRKHKSSFEAHYLTKAEWARLGHALKSYETKYPKQVAVLRVLALTGARFGEVLNLKWDQIDGPRAVFYDTKSQERTIWLGKPARRLLASLPRTSDFVFEHNGAALKQGRVNPVWNKIRDAAKLPKVRIHDLRHSFASVAINSGVDLRQVAGLLAHSDLKTTEGYAHLDVKTVKSARERVGRHFEKIFTKPQKRERSIYAKFTTSHLRFADFCEAHDLDPTVFRKDLIAWRESNRGAAQ